MYQLNPAFYKNWVDVSNIWVDNPAEIIVHPCNLDVDFFKQLSFDPTSLKKYRTEAVEKCLEVLGNNPAVCLSGGIDSQAMVQCFVEAKADFKLYSCKFSKDYNLHDLEFARMFAKHHKLNLIEVELDVINFLTKENYDFGLKYKSASPQFNTHYKFFDKLLELGSTGIVTGGNAPELVNNVWGSTLERNAMTFIQYSNINEVPVIGSFLGYYPHLAWGIALQTNSIEMEFNNINHIYGLRKQYLDSKYLNRLSAYKKAGFKVARQEQKFTGFEKVKLYFEELTGDGWTFEKRFRDPLEELFLKHKTDKFKIGFLPGVEEVILSIHSKNLMSFVESSPGI